jgi:septum formation protein
MKAEACVQKHKELKRQGFLVLGADTIVVLGSRIFGKPQNKSQACEFLRALASKTHSVISGFTLWETGSTKLWSGAVETRVTFRDLHEEEIQSYVAGGEPMDKAGAYAIQGEGRKFVSSFSGSWSNVVGLPLERLEEVLRENGWNVRRRTPAQN